MVSNDAPWDTSEILTLEPTQVNRLLSHAVNRRNIVRMFRGGYKSCIVLIDPKDHYSDSGWDVVLFRLMCRFSQIPDAYHAYISSFWIRRSHPGVPAHSAARNHNHTLRWVRVDQDITGASGIQFFHWAPTGNSRITSWYIGIRGIDQERPKGLSSIPIRWRTAFHG